MSNPTLLDVILARSTGKGSRIHGPTHWAGVAAAGLTLLDSTPEADPLVVLLFAMFHDSMRQSDGHDPEHGKRGAELARRMRDAGEFELDEKRLLKLEQACTYHDKGQTSADPSIGVCWDADRLNLLRVNIRPKPALLSTSAARWVASTRLVWMFPSQVFEWRALFLEYGARRDPDQPTVYLRFGDLPPCGTSNALLSILRECGVSVYPASKRGGSYVLDFRRLLFGTDTSYVRSLLYMARPLYVVEGRQVGIGGVGEPVLEDACIVEEVSPRNVDVLPLGEPFANLLEAWRLKREGKDLGYAAFFGPVRNLQHTADPDSVYLRFGDLPESGRSHIGLGFYEGGISVYSGRFVSESEYRIEAKGWQQTWTLANFTENQNRPGFFVKGRQVGGGSDGEALLADITHYEPVLHSVLVTVAGLGDTFFDAEIDRCLQRWNERRGACD